MTLDREGVIKYLTDLDSQSKAIKNEALKFGWYMRGGLSYEDAMFLSTSEREMVAEIIKENVEKTKNSGVNFL